MLAITGGENYPFLQGIHIIQITGNMVIFNSLVKTPVFVIQLITDYTGGALITGEHVD